MKKILNSIQAKLFFTVVSVVLMTILFLVIVNSVVFEAYYYYHIKNHLVSSYEKASNRKDGFKPNEKAMANLREEIEKTSNALITLRQKQDNLAKSSLIGMPKMVDNVGKSVENVTKKVLKWGLAIFGIRSAYNAVRNAVSTLSQYNDQIKTDIEFIKYEDNIVYIKMLGACAGCELIDMTLKEGIEMAIKEEVPSVEKVVNVTFEDILGE